MGLVRANELYSDRLGKNPVGGAQTTYNTMRSTINRHRNKCCERSPKTLAEVGREFNSEVTMKAFGYSLRDPSSAIYRGTVDEPGYGFTLFASEMVLKYIALQPAKQHYHVDGTFRVVPDTDFRQLLVIHLSYKDHVSIFITGIYHSIIEANRFARVSFLPDHILYL